MVALRRRFAAWSAPLALAGWALLAATLATPVEQHEAGNCLGFYTPPPEGCHDHVEASFLLSGASRHPVELGLSQTDWWLLAGGLALSAGLAAWAGVRLRRGASGSVLVGVALLVAVLGWARLGFAILATHGVSDGTPSFPAFGFWLWATGLAALAASLLVRWVGLRGGDAP